MSFDDSVAPYGNHYNIAKRFDKVLFRPGRPAFSQELLEMQSIQDEQLQALGDSLFQEGAIISGMDIIPKPDKKIVNKDTPNTFTVSSLFADNAKYDTSNYVDKGEIDIVSEANLPTDVVGLEMHGNSTIGQVMTASFTIRKMSGHLNRLNIQYDEKRLKFTGWKIDGNPVVSAINDIATKDNLLGDNNAKINLDDGEEHKVEAHFKVQQSGNYNLKLVLNGGFDSTFDTVTAKLLYPYFEDSDTVTPTWHINSDDSGTPSAQERVKNYTVKSGRVYLNGAVRLFDQQDFSIKGVGREEIGLRVNEDVVTAQDDPSLLDDTPNAVTRGEAGADRLHYGVVLTYNDSSAVPFVVFQDNVINPRAVKPDYSNLEPILAKRTYDQSGSFRAYGFEGHMRKNPDPTKGAQDPTDASKILLDIDKGQAYVRGYSISTSQPTTLKLDIANSTANTVNEGYFYKRNDSNPIRLYNQPVKNVMNVTYTVEHTNERVDYKEGGDTTKVTINSKDTITNVISVRDATRGYTEGSDYTVSGNTIYLGVYPSGKSLPGSPNLPTPGQSLYVTYDCTHNAVRGVDYKVVTSSDGITSIDINSMGDQKNKPKDSSNVLVTYDYFTARIDMIRITMDQANPFKVVKGQPAPLNTVVPPLVKDPTSLELGYVLIKPNSHDAVFTMQTITSISFNTLQQWGKRLTNTEQNVALNNMHEEIKRSEDPRILKDAFADSFNTIYNRDDATTTTAYDFENGSIFLPTQAAADIRPQLDKKLSTYAEKDVKGRLVTAPYHDEPVIDQPIWTDVTNINEFNVFTANGTLTISPDTDNWTDMNHTTAFNVVHEAQPLQLHKWWRHENDHSRGWYGDGRDPAAHAAEQRIAESQWDQLHGITDTGAGNSLGETGWMIAQGGTQTTKQAQEFMRPKKINFVAKNFKPYKGGFHITIDGTPVQAPTPESAAYNGDPNDGDPNKEQKGGICTYFQADGKGEIHGSFVIPGGTVRCGTRTVTIFNSDNDQASTTYTANGTTVTNTDIIEKRVYTVNLWDPLAQSFYLPETRQLSNILLYFKSKPKVDDSSSSTEEYHRPQLIVQIREVGDEGMPNRTVRAEQYLDPSQIKVSGNASVATKIHFDDAVTLNANQGYAIVLISDSNEYSVFTATKGHKVKNSEQASTVTVYDTNPEALTNKDPKAMGQNETITSKISVKPGDVLERTPNVNGDLFISNNGMTWQPDGGSSLMFTVNACKYDTKNAEIIFEPIIFSDFDNYVKSVWEQGTDLGPKVDPNNINPNNKDPEQTPNSKLKASDRMAALVNFLSYNNTTVHWFIKYLKSGAAGVDDKDPNQVRSALDGMQWTPVVVNNGNQTISAPGASEEYAPEITDNTDPQQVDGEMNLFTESAGIQLRAVFDVDKYISPVLKTDDLSLALFLTGKQAAYESVTLDESGDANFNKVKVEFDAYLPGDDCSVTPMYSIDDSKDNSNTWLNFPGDGSKSVEIDKDDKDDKISSKPVKTQVISRYFTRYTYEATIPDVTYQGKDGQPKKGMGRNHLASKFKLRLKMKSATNFRTPRVKQLTAVMKCDLPDDLPDDEHK